MYRLELEELSRWVREKKLTRILIQAPPGLRALVPRVIKHLESMGVEAIVSAGNCWGACDMAYDEAEAVRADGLIHMGHARLLRSERIPTFYMECRYSDPKPLLDLAETIAQKLDGVRRVGIGMTVQWLDFLEQFSDKLRELRVTPFIGDIGVRTIYPGQIIGCDYSCLWNLEGKVEGFLVVGSPFHGLGIALTSPKPVYMVDPELGKVVEMKREVERVLGARYAWIEVFRKAERVGIIVGVKPGQRRIAVAVKLRKMLRAAGKEAELVAVDELTEEELTNLPYEGYVNTACPRLSIEDQRRFPVPILLPSETLTAIGRARWEKVIYSPQYLGMEVR